MSKVLISGDWQLDSRPSCDRRDKRGRSIRFEENVETLLTMVKDAAAQGCTQMVFLGDLTEELNPDSKSLKGASSVFRTAMDAGILRIDNVAGNHDGSIYDISSSSLEPLSEISKGGMVTWHEAGHLTMSNGAKDGSRPAQHFVFLPYLHQATPEQIRAELVRVTDPLEGDLFLFGHYGAKLSKMGAKNMVLAGDYLDANTMLADQFKRIWMGHIHKSQFFMIGQTPFGHPGSPYVVDFGERDDPKGYCIFDTESCIDQWVEIKPRRRWLSIDYNEMEQAMEQHAQGGDPMSTFPLPWTDQDIVKFTGTFSPTKNPREMVRLNFKNEVWGVQPFFMTDDFKRVQEGRDVRDGVEAVSGAGGFAEAVAAFVAKRWPDHPRAAEVIKTVVDELKESRLASLERFVIPTRIVATEFMSHKLFDYNLEADQATLIIGPNGLGKTNILEAILFASTGETSKGLVNKMLVKQGAKKASTLLFLRGEKNLFFINRTVTLTKTGATHKVEAGTTPIEGAAPDWYLDKKKYTSLADGGIADTQAAISAIIGATYKSLRATNFMFQKDKSPFIESDPLDRKGIMGEILGFEPMAKAWKALDGKRLGSQRVLGERRAELDGLKSAIDPAKEKATAEALAKVEAEVPGLAKDVEAKERQANELKQLVDLAAKKLEDANAALQAMPDSSGLLTGAEDELKTLSSSFTDERKRRVKVYTSDKAQIEALRSKIQTIDVKALTAKIEEFKAAKTQAQVVLDLLAPEMTRLATVKAEARTKLKGLDKDHAGYGREIEALRRNDIGKCSKCGGPIDSKHIEKEIADLEVRAKENRDVYVPPLNLAVKAADQELLVLAVRKQEAGAVVDAMANGIEGLTAKVSGVQSKGEELGRLETRLKDTEVEGLKAKGEYEAKKVLVEKKIFDLKAVVEKETKARTDKEAARVTASANATTASANASTAVSDLSGAKVALVAAQTTLDSLRRALEAFSEVKGKVVAKEAAVAEGVADLELRAMASEVLDPKVGLPVWLIDARIPELEDAINRYMDVFGAEGLTIRLTTVKEDGKETLDVLVDNGEEPILDVAAYSGGQLGRIEVCIKMALADLAESMRDVRLGLLAYDEPGVHLDEERKTKLIEMIHERCSSGRTPVALVISHDRKLMAGFRRRLAITKTDEVTELVAA